MKIIFAALALFLGISSANAETPAWEKQIFSSISKDTTIYVQFSDNAKGGCWTNAASAKRNLMGALEEKGFRTGFTIRAPSLVITVNAIRMADGGCIGHYSIDLICPVETKHYDLQFVEITLTGGYGLNPDNFNKVVMDKTEDAAREFRNKYYEAREK